MLTKVTANNLAPIGIPLEDLVLPLTSEGRADLFDDNSRYVILSDIVGLGPVKANVNTSPLGSVDGVSYTGSSVPERNIVFTIQPNPDWIDWTVSKIRDFLYNYFMPKSFVRLVFESDERQPVTISGYVESFDPSIFSKDNENQISIICPNPYFEATSSFLVTDADDITQIDYNGTVDAGINLEVTKASGADAAEIDILFGAVPPDEDFFTVAAPVTAATSLSLGSVPGNKYVRSITTPGPVIVNRLNDVQAGSKWPLLQPGSNYFAVESDAGVQHWELTYKERFGGL